MNKKGTIFLTILITIVYFMVGMMVYQLLKPDITTARDATHLNCSSPADWGDMFTCLELDGVIPIMIILIFSIAGGIITDDILT